MPLLNRVGGGGAAEIKEFIWESGSGLNSGTMSGLAYGNGRLVSTGVGVASYSLDKGVSWANASGVTTSMYFKAACFGNLRFVACSKYSEIMYSTTATSWTSIGRLDTTNNPEFNDIIYDGVSGNYVTVGAAGNVWYATDPTAKANWSQGTGLDTTKNYYGLAAAPSVGQSGEDRIVAVGDDGACAYSDDGGATWNTGYGLPTNKDYRNVVYGNGRFLAIGLYGACAWSSDGKYWYPLSSLDTAVSFYNITFGNGIFVAVGINGNSKYTLYGDTWIDAPGLKTSNSYYGVTFGDGYFVTTGNGTACGYFDAREPVIDTEDVTPEVTTLGPLIAEALELAQTKAGVGNEVYFITDGTTETYAQLASEEQVALTASANDIRLGTIAVTDDGVTTGEKDIPTYHTTTGARLIPANAEFKIPIPDYDRYDYTKLQAMTMPYNTSMSDSLAVDRAVIEDNVYPVGSTESVATVTKDDANKAISLGITNGDTPAIIRYFTYKEVQ